MTAAGLDQVLRVAALSWPQIPTRHFITAFAGLRAHCDRNDFILGEAADVPGLFNAAGIESPGLTAAPAIQRPWRTVAPSRLAAIRPELEELEAEFRGERQRGVIPDDQQIASRLTELEAIR